MTNEIFITKTLRSTSSSDESSEMELVCNTSTGETEIVISKTITERYPVTDYQKAIHLYESINGGGGRKKLQLKDFAKR